MREEPREATGLSALDESSGCQFYLAARLPDLSPPFYLLLRSLLRLLFLLAEGGKRPGREERREATGQSVR